MSEERQSVLIPLRVTPTMAGYLDRLVIEGAYAGRTEVIRSILEAVRRDDKREHGEAA